MAVSSSGGMRTALYDNYGEASVLYAGTLPKPVPTQTQVLIRVAAASVNGYDILMRSGALKITASRTFPKQTGLDFVGTVQVAPPSAPQFRVGDEVWGVVPLHQLTSMSEYIAVEPQNVSHRPQSLRIVEAAALPVVAGTALLGLREITSLQRGDRLLVRGASGGVGSMAVQIGKSMGDHVTGLASSANLEYIRQLGADAVLDYAATTAAAAGDFDVIFDTVGSNTSAWRRRLTRRGRMAAIVPDPKHPLRSLLFFKFSAIFGQRRVRYFNAQIERPVLEELTRMADAKTIRPTVEGIYLISRIADAHRAFEARGSRGKQIIVIDGADR